MNAGTHSDAPVERGGIVLVIASFEAGGAERVLLHLANGCAEHIPTTLVVLDGSGALRDRLEPDVRLIDLQHRRARSAALPLIRVIRRLRPDVVVASQAHVNILLALARPFLPRPLRIIVREAGIHRSKGLTDRIIRLAHRTVYRWIDLVLVTSPWMAADLRRRRRAAVEILPNPVDVDALRAASRDALRTMTDRPGRHFIHVGRLAAGKGVLDVVAAFDAGHHPDDTLTIVGDGPERGRIADHVAAAGLSRQVRLVGFDPEPARHLAGADLLVLASYSEGMPNVVLESLAVGTPVLAPDDLVTLEALAAAAPSGALRLVPRVKLADALAATPAPSRGWAGPRDSLLPDGSLPSQVIARFLGLAFGPGGSGDPGGSMPSSGR